MCGIAGYYVPGRQAAPDGTGTIVRMVRPLAQRGPDDEGIALLDPDGGHSLALHTEATTPELRGQMPMADEVRFPHRVAFGHRRFSIIDPTPRGHQPFFSADGAVCAIFNGEIYNYLELAEELRAAGRTLATRCDTEVLVEGYLEWGTGCFERFAGFWAVALYDARRRSVLLARDRIGKAPLYIGRHGGVLYWASEIKGVRAGPSRDAFGPRPQAISDFVAFGHRDVYDHTFFQGIETFPRAAWAWIETDGGFTPTRYWDLPSRRQSERKLEAGAAAGELRRRLADALRVRLRADVPIGIHLSGGTDSSALVALAASEGQRLRAYTVSYPGTESDEEPYARQVAERWREAVDYNVITPSESEFFDNADWYLSRMDEPFHSPSMLAAQLVWREMAAQGLRVSIDGGAADELLCGYVSDYYIPYLSWLAEHGRLARLGREAASLSELPAPPGSRLFLQRVKAAAVDGVRRRRPGGWPVNPPPSATALLADGPSPTRRHRAPIERLLRENATDWLMNYWLRSGHQNYMGVPLEVRSPFLDHRVIEFAFSLPVSYLIRDGWLKWILRQAAQDVLPDGVTWRRRKMGFPFPIQSWLRANERRFWAAVGHAGRERCPFIDHGALARDYGSLSASDPMLLWRAMCVALWWRRCVLDTPLAA